MKTGDTFECTDHNKFKITKEGKSGGQGSTWKVHDINTKKEFFLKIINEEDRTLKYKKIQNIRYLYDNKRIYIPTLLNRRYNIALPLHIYDRNGEFGYVMQACPGNEINHYMSDDTFAKMTMRKKLEIILELAEAIAWLQQNGLCYQDISHKNFMYCENNGNPISLIDCDNLAPVSDVHSGDRNFVKGTSFYIAPEVAFDVDRVSQHSDNYAMAVLFYKILTGSTDSPYHGQILYSKRPRPMSMLDAASYVKEDPDYGKEWLTFIFDENNKCNAININQFSKNEEWCRRQKSIADNWESVPESIKKLFNRSFCDPLNPQLYKKRPTASKWKEIIKNILQSDSDITMKVVSTTNTQSNIQPSIPGLTIIFPNDKKITVNDLYVLDGTMVGFSKLKLGRIEKNNTFVFVSECLYAIQCNMREELIKKSDQIEIQDGMEICIATKPSQKIRFNL